MDNASKNATDMINSLRMKYNRGRQAAITNELVDIITGASGMCPIPPHLRICRSGLTLSSVQRSNDLPALLSMLLRTNPGNGLCRYWIEMDYPLQHIVSRSAGDVVGFSMDHRHREVVPERQRPNVTDLALMAW